LENQCHVVLNFLYQGLEQSWSEHAKCVQLLHQGVEDMGLELFVKDKVR